MKQKGFKGICYEDGAESWPLGVRCLALLAGSVSLLDSAKAEFADQLGRLLTQCLRAEAEKHREVERVRHVMSELGIVGASPPMISVFRSVLRVSALSDLPALIVGETGTGKELLARAIYQLDLKRRHGPFVALNCGAVSPGIAESELFGHRRGAFTGAEGDRKGLIRSAHGGVLFLDEIGELDSALQTKLLRVLQENRVLGVGEDQEVAVNVHIMAATNRNLDEMVQQRRFRADLYHRINVLSVHIPPLRDRPADMKPLIEHFLQKHRSLRPAGPVSAAPDFVEALTQVELPGNVRQLENLVRRALLNKEDDTSLDLSDLPEEVWQQLSQPRKDSLPPPEPAREASYARPATTEATPRDVPAYLVRLLDASGWNLARSLRYCEKSLLESVLHLAHGNQAQTARLLGITPRSVYNKVRKHGLHM